MANKASFSAKLHNKSDNPALEKRLDDILERLYDFYHSGIDVIDMSLERLLRFLHQLDDPHLKLPPVIHVAGTNGKGSTIATLRSLLETSGKRVHVMTSPHLVHPTERVRLAGELITTQALVDVLEECLAVNEQQSITFFEILTAAIFLIMSRVPADYALLETGMGGRLDASNVVPDPVCTIITTISKDHEKFLGGSLKQIAFEKASIMKAGVPCIIGYQTPQAHEAGVPNVFHEVSKNLSPEAKLFQYGQHWCSARINDQMQFTWQGDSIITSLPNLLGPHQIYNAGAALAAYRVITGEAFDAKILSPNDPQNPLLTIHWPGRLQRLENHRFNKLIPSNAELWIDGGHNDSAGMMLSQQAKIWQGQDDKKLHLIVAMVNRKNPQEFLAPLVPYAESLTVTAIENEHNSFSAEELYDFAVPLGFKKLSKAESVKTALSHIRDNNSRILITGSLYLLGTVLK